MNSTILSVATGTYVKRAEKQTQALAQIEHGCTVMRWFNKFPKDSPPHFGHRWPHPNGMVPYRFKTYAIKEALEAGHRQIMWLDSSVVPVRPLDPILKHIEENGYWFHLNGWNVGEWCCDSALAPLGITREESFNIPLCVGGAFALDLDHWRGHLFYEELLAYPDEAFCGPWTNDNNGCSCDSRVKGHRHDQTVMSVIAFRIPGMELMAEPRWFCYGDSTKLETLPEEVILVAD